MVKPDKKPERENLQMFSEIFLFLISYLAFLYVTWKKRILKICLVFDSELLIKLTWRTGEVLFHEETR